MVRFFFWRFTLLSQVCDLLAWLQFQKFIDFVFMAEISLSFLANVKRFKKKLLADGSVMWRWTSTCFLLCLLKEPYIQLLHKAIDVRAWECWIWETCHARHQPLVCKMCYTVPAKVQWHIDIIMHKLFSAITKYAISILWHIKHLGWSVVLLMWILQLTAWLLGQSIARQWWALTTCVVA